MNLFLNLLLLLFLHFSWGIDEQACFFPESEVHPFFFDVFSDAATDTVIVESVVEPPDSHLVLASVRSGNIPEVNFTNRFSLETTNSGRFMLKTTSPLVLPIYPSEVEETYLYVTVVCNHHAYPLITIRVKAANLLAPQFYNEPYVLEVDESLPIGSYLDTPIIAVDWDPSPSYNITFQLQDTEVPFEVVTENMKRVSQLSFGKSLNWTTAQLPTLVRLRVLKKIEKLPIKLNLIAKDAGQPQQFTTTTLNIISKHTKERPDFKTHPTKVSLPIQAPFVNINDEMVSTQNSSSNNIGPSSEDELPRFKDCNILVTLPENTEPGTYVTTLKILNRKKWTMIDMVDPDGTFDIKQDSGDVIVRDNRLLDREMFTSIELVAEIHGSNHRTECFRVRVNVELLDENDNKPAFEKEKYCFHVSDELLIGSQIGKLRAQDIDEADGGRVTYHIVNSSEYIPFTIETQGKDGILLLTGDLSRRDVYQLEVAARDHGNPSRSSQVPVDIYVLKSATKQQAKKPGPLKKALIKGVASVTASSLNLNAIEDNDSKELITTRTEPVTVISVNDASTVAEDKEATLTSSKIITVITPATITQESTSEKDTQEPHKSTTFTVGSHPTLTNIRLINKEIAPSKPTRSTLIESMEEYFEDDDREQEQKSEENTDEELFAFKDLTYYYEVFGEPIEGDIIGRVIAEPEAQMYGLERTMAGIFKLDPDIGELAVGKKLYNQKEGNLTFEVSATNGISTVRLFNSFFKNRLL